MVVVFSVLAPVDADVSVKHNVSMFLLTDGKTSNIRKINDRFMSCNETFRLILFHTKCPRRETRWLLGFHDNQDKQ
jgi:hypothetical protein